MWTFQNSHFSYNISETRVSRKEKEVEPYQGDLEWRRDAENARRQKATIEGLNTRINNDKGAFGKIFKPKKPSNTIKENYEYKNVTDEFKDTVKRIIFSGNVTNEGKEVKRSDTNSRENSRGWYDPF